MKSAPAGFGLEVLSFLGSRKGSFESIKRNSSSLKSCLTRFTSSTLEMFSLIPDFEFRHLHNFTFLRTITSQDHPVDDLITCPCVCRENEVRAGVVNASRSFPFMVLFSLYCSSRNAARRFSRTRKSRLPSITPVSFTTFSRSSSTRHWIFLFNCLKLAVSLDHAHKWRIRDELQFGYLTVPGGDVHPMVHSLRFLDTHEWIVKREATRLRHNNRQGFICVC